MALSNLYLTDFDRLVEVADKDLPDSRKIAEGRIGEASAFSVMVTRAKVMKELGCVMADDGLPINHVTGFAKQPGDPTKVKEPKDILSRHIEIGLLFWGSPHFNSSACSDEHHGSMKSGATYKTEAFESIAWMAPRAFVIMPFPDKYRVEFYQPQYDKDAEHRVLIVARAYVRNYRPMTSSNGYRYPIANTNAEQVMVAMLVPPRFLHCISYVEGKVDFGKTCLRVLGSLTSAECGVALGCYDLSCEMEIVLAYWTQRIASSDYVCDANCDETDA